MFTTPNCWPLPWIALLCSGLIPGFSICAWTRDTTIHAVSAHGYRGHIRRIGEEKLDAIGGKRHPARRCVVERTLAWLSKSRTIPVRHDKKASNYVGLTQLAGAPFGTAANANSGFDIVHWYRFQINGV